MLTPEPPRSIFDGIDRRGDAIGALIAPLPQWVTNGMRYGRTLPTLWMIAGYWRCMTG